MECNYQSLTASQSRVCQWSVHLPEMIFDPSPTLYTNAVMLYGLTATGLYITHRDDEFQDYFLACGVIVGLVVSCFMVAIEGNRGAVKDYMSAFITLGYIASFVFHLVCRSL